MTNVNFQVETERLRKDTDGLKAISEKLKATREKMYNEISILGTMWDGEAKNAFTTQFAGDNVKLEEVEKIVSVLIGNFEQAIEKYNACENSVGSIVDSMRI